MFNFLKRNKIKKDTNALDELILFLMIELDGISLKKSNLNFIEFMNFLIVFNNSLRNKLQSIHIDDLNTKLIEDLQIYLKESNEILNKWHSSYSFWYSNFKNSRNEKYIKLINYGEPYIFLHIQQFFPNHSEIYHELTYLISELDLIHENVSKCNILVNALQ
jgi:hypothetical protein